MKRARGVASGVVRLLAALLLPISALAGPVIWIDDDRNGLHTVDLDTAASTFIGTISASQELTDIAMSPSGELWGISFTSMWIIDKTTAGATLVGRHGISGGNALTFDSEGRLFAAGGSGNRLYSIDTTTGVGTALPGTMGAGSAGDIVFADDALYLADTSGRLVRLLLSGPFPYEVTPVTVGDLSVANVFGLALASDTTGRLFATAGDTVYEVNKVTAGLTSFSQLPAGVRANGATSENAASIVISEPPDVLLDPFADLLVLNGSTPSAVALACNYGVGFDAGSGPPGDVSKNLVLLIHGWNSDPEAWAAAQQRAIVANIRARGDSTVWDVCSLDWSELAASANPWNAYGNGPAVVDAVWPQLRLHQYRFVHLVGHSAGSLIADMLASNFKGAGGGEPAVVHTTFLDAYDAGFNDDQFNSQYGCSSDWSDSYVDTRGDIYGLIKNTNLILGCALNIDVTRADPVQNANPNPLNLALVLLEDQRVHAWPYRLYSYTAGVQSGATDSLDPLDVWVFGFGASKESMRLPFNANPNAWQPLLRQDPGDPTGLPSYAASGTSPGSTYCLRRVLESGGVTRTRTADCVTGVIIDTPPSSDEPVEQVWSDFVLDLEPAWQGPTAESTPSTTGVVTTDLPSPMLARLRTGSPAWIVYTARVSEPLDTIRFKYDFASAAGSNGLLSVYVDNKPVYRMTLAVGGDALRSSGLIRVGRLEPGYHSLAFRLDSLTAIPSEVTISGLETGRLILRRAAAVSPVAVANGPQQARLGSVVSLEGAATQQPGSAPTAVTFFWSQVAGPTAVFSDPWLSRTQFTANTAGEYRVQLKARNLWLASQPVVVTIRVPILGDVDLDGDVDKSDVAHIQTALSALASGPNDVRDLNGDMRISDSDVAIAKAECTVGDCGDKTSRNGGGGTVDRWALLALGLFGGAGGRRRRFGMGLTCTADDTGNKAGSSYGRESFMRVALIALVLATCLAISTHCVAEEAKPLTNQDVVAMVKAGLPESTILLSIKNSQTDFTRAPADLIALKEAGVSQPVLDAMLTHGGEAPSAAAYGASVNYAAMAGVQGVVAVDADRRLPLKITATGFRQNVRPGLLLLGQKHTRYAVMKGERSKTRITSRTPSFEMSVPSSVQADQLVKLVRMKVKNGSRETPDYMMSFGLTRQKDLGDDVVATTIEPVAGAGSSMYEEVHRMIPSAALEPGEYAVVFNGQFWDFGVD